MSDYNNQNNGNSANYDWNQRNRGHTNYGWQNGHGKSGYRKHNRYNHNKRISFFENIKPSIEDFIKNHSALVKKITDLSERKMRAEEKKADALYVLSIALAKISGCDDIAEKLSADISSLMEDENYTKDVSVSDKKIASDDPDVYEENAADDYKNPDETSPKDENKITEDVKFSDRNKILSDINGLRENGMSYEKIARFLEQEKVPTISGRGKWHASTVSGLLKSAPAD